MEYSKYLEVFGGSGNVLLGKPPDEFEAFNDYNHELINLFRCIQRKPLALMLEIGMAPPSSREDFEAIFRFFKLLDKLPKDFIKGEVEAAKLLLPRRSAQLMIHFQKRRYRDKDVQKAAMFLRMHRTSFFSLGKSFSGQPFSAKNVVALIEAVQDRFSNVVLENQPFEKFIKHYDSPGSFFYCDPPYLETESMYTAPFSWEDHLMLRELAGGAATKGKFLISYNDCETIRELYKDFYFFDFRRVHSMSNHSGYQKEFPELVIANYDILERQRQKPRQSSIFTDEDDLTGAELAAILKECILTNGKK